MKRPSIAVLLGSVAIAVFAAAAVAQTDDNANPPSSTPPTSVPVSDQANAQASTAAATANARLAAIRTRALTASKKDQDRIEPKLDATKSSVDREASAKGDNVIAGRLADEFGLTSDALLAEKTQFKTGWGDLMIAHALLANAKTDITMSDLFQMHTDGMGWGQIANGLDLRLGDLVSAVASEGRVATGHAKADGKVAAIHSRTTSHAGSTHAKSGATTHPGMGAGAGASRGHSGK